MENKNKKIISILGDSISTFAGYTPAGAVFYDDWRQRETGVADPGATWWMQVIEGLGGVLGVNNSYSGSTVSCGLLTSGTSLRRLETLGAEAGAAFDNAFRFLEQTFGDSQELVLFVTEVTAGYDTSWFVENFGCDAYFRHNRELLFDDTRHRIREEIAAARAAEREETKDE